MDFIDDEAGVSDEESTRVPSSQPDGDRSPKRRKVARNDGESDYDLPSNNHSEDEDAGYDSPLYRSKYDGVTHIIQHAETQKETFVTQLTQPWSSPTRIRGPRWVKRTAQSPSPSVSLSQEPETRPSVPQTSPRSLAANPTLPTAIANDGFADDSFDDDDSALLEAFDYSPQDMATFPEVSQAPSRTTNNFSDTFPRKATAAMRQTTLFGVNTTQPPAAATQSARTHKYPLTSREEAPTHHKLDTEAMKTWIYPTNLGRIRDYQYNIVHKSLFNNILVALPTGLGKTFIAATVILNFYRWTKQAQIVFVAPTRPLVNQQAEACYGIAGMPKSETIILTGEVNTDVRAEDWEEKRVFFMTPQTLFNDLESGRADPKKIVLLVVDEAHKATGNYAYVQVVKFLRKYSSSFRVLALTATPGGTVEAVQKVVDGLDIARVEIRTEESIDIRDFVYSRDTQLEIFDNSDELATCLELFAAAVGPVLSKLASMNAHWGRDPTMMTLFGLRRSQMEWNKSEAGRKAHPGTKQWVNSMFQPLMKLAHNLELLKFHGIGPFNRKMKAFEEESSSLGKSAKQIVQDQHFQKLMNYMRAWVGNPEFVGHPKLEYLKEVVLNHFLDAGEVQEAGSRRAAKDTRIMIFAHYRDSAEEVVRILDLLGPMVKPRIFVGQSGTKGSEGMNQKTQLDILRKFKDGTFNTLVATSIGEEGLDIGEVDLIVCYDSSKSPIRMLQRMGRTGRKRAGKIAVLLMRGKEEGDYYKAKDSYQKMQEIIEGGRDFTFHDDRSPRIVPKEIVPVVDKRHIDIPVENTQGPLPDHSKRVAKKKHKRPPKEFYMPDGVQTGFSFLGKGNKKSAATSSKRLRTLDLEEATLPPLEQVLLSVEDQEQLEMRYQQVAGTEPQYIEEIRVDAYPDHQRVFTKIARVEHSSASKAFVGALNSMRNPEKDWTRPTSVTMPSMSACSVTPTWTPAAVQQQPHQSDRKQPQASKDFASSDTRTSDGHDEADSFIDDASQRNESPDTSPDLSAILKLGDHKKNIAEQPFWQSQKSSPEANTLDEEDLPPLENLFDHDAGDVDDAMGLNPSMNGQVVARRHATRRVLDSDDDDE